MNGSSSNSFINIYNNTALTSISCSSGVNIYNNTALTSGSCGYSSYINNNLLSIINSDITNLQSLQIYKVYRFTIIMC